MAGERHGVCELAFRVQEVKASCHKLSQSTKPGSTVENPTQNGDRRNGVNMNVWKKEIEHLLLAGKVSGYEPFE
jgi:hypothetical protein